jgi:glutamate:GABA antiporter
VIVTDDAQAPARGQTPPHLQRVLGRADIVLMIVAGIVNVNTLAPIVANGNLALWLWPLACLVVLVPQGITVVELSQHYPGDGGVYLWPNRFLGQIHGFLSGWCYWISSVVYVPTLIVAAVGLALYAFGERGVALSSNPVVVESAALGVLLVIVGLNIRGLAIAKWLVDMAAIGTLLIGGLLISLAAWLALTHRASGNSLALHVETLDWHFLSAFSLVSFSLLGLEIASNVGSEIRDTRRILPGAVLLGAALTALTYLVLIIAMLVTLPQQDVRLVQGVLQAIGTMAGKVGLGPLMPGIAAILALSITGAASAWLGAPSRIPFVAAQEGYLPRSLAKLHPRYASPHIALLVFGALCGLVLCMSFAGATLTEAYLTILDLSVILALLQYLYMYASVVSLALRHRHIKTMFSRVTLTVVGIGGLSMTLLGTAFAFVPTRQIAHVWLFELKLLGSCVLLLGVGVAVFFMNARRTRPEHVSANPLR